MHMYVYEFEIEKNAQKLPCLPYGAQIVMESIYWYALIYCKMLAAVDKL